MNKTDLIAAVAEKAGLAKTDTKKALEAFVATVSEELAKGEKIALIGFGTFSVSEKSARTGINPATTRPPAAAFNALMSKARAKHTNRI